MTERNVKAWVVVTPRGAIFKEGAYGEFSIYQTKSMADADKEYIREDAQVVRCTITYDDGKEPDAG